MKKAYLQRWAACGLASIAMGAAAQSATPTPQASLPVDSGAALGSEALGSKAVPVGPEIELPPGPLTEVGNRLRDSGVSLGMTFVNMYFSNPSTGIEPGNSANYGNMIFNVGLDLGKIAGLHGTELNLTQVVNRPSRNTDTYLFQTGSGFTPYPVITTATDLANLTIRQRAMDDRLKLEFGRMNLTGEYMVGNMCSGCIMSTQATVLNQPGLTKSVWGGSARYSLDKDRTVGFAMLQDNSDNWQNTNGWDWGRGKTNGYIAMMNYTQRKGFDDSAYPYRLEAGAYHNSARYDDPLYNTDGSSKVQNSSGTPLEHKGRSGLYAQGRKVYWTRDGDRPGVPENLAAYGGFAYTAGSAQDYPFEAYAGSEWSGFSKSNPLAMVGFNVRYLRLGERRALYEQQTRLGYTMAMNAMTGGAVSVVDDRVPQNMLLFDVHGRVGLMPGVFLEASVQYLKNPNSLIPATYQRSRNGYMFSLMLVADFGVLSGLSRMPGDKIF
ncbi:MAG: carbohydrate porin [Variovorax sp.]